MGSAGNVLPGFPGKKGASAVFIRIKYRYSQISPEDDSVIIIFRANGPKVLPVEAKSAIRSGVSGNKMNFRATSWIRRQREVFLLNQLIR